MRPALQREHDLEGQKRGNEARTENGNEASAAAGARFGRTEARERGQRCSGSATWKDRKRHCCSGSTIWNNRRRGNGASAAAGATFPVRAQAQGSLLVCGPKALHRRDVEQEEAELDT